MSIRLLTVKMQSRGFEDFLRTVFGKRLSGARSKFWGVSGSEDRGGGDNSIQSINIGRVGDKSFKEWRGKIGGGGGRVGDNNILTFLCYRLCH